MDMREQIKKRFKKRRYAVLLTLFVGVLFFLLRGQFSHAADQIFIQFNGADLDPAVTHDDKQYAADASYGRNGL